MVLQNAAEVPLENTRAGLHEWVEDIYAILLDMMETYYGRRPVVIDNEVREFDFSVFKHLWLNVSVDVGATTYYSEIAMVQTLDNLRRDGVLSVIDYLERMPDKLITRKQELIESLRARAAPEVSNGSQGGGFSIASELDAAKKIAQLPASMQAKYSSLPNVAQRALMR